jgi:hypothetical protein
VALDRIKPLKIESIDSGGDEDDQYPTSLDPQEDHVECAGVIFDDPDQIDESTVITRVDADMLFKDGNNTDYVTLTQLLEGGITEDDHENFDTLVHEIAETSYEEITRTSGRVTSVIIWETSAKLKKVRETTITRAAGQVSVVIEEQYDAAGALKKTLTGTITRVGGKVSSIDWVKA